MARKPNYDFEKRRKELARKQKQEEKRERKRIEQENASGQQELLDPAPAPPASPE